MKGKVLFVLNPEFGHSTAHIRGLIFQESLAANDWLATFVSISPNHQNPETDKLRKSTSAIIAMAKDFDLIYLLKVNSYAFIKELRRNSNARIIFDLTDALWRPNFRVNWLNLEEILGLSDAVFSENEYVCEYARRYNDQVFNLPACTQIEKFDALREQGVVKDSSKVVLGWIGTDATANGIFSLAKTISRLQGTYAEVDLRIVGAGIERLRRPLSGVRFSYLENYKESDMIREALAMDIGLFPAPGDLEDYRLRGPLKALIYMSAGIPAVCLNAGDPATLITDGVNGMLINSPEEWEHKIETLVRDAHLRRDMGRKGYETVMAKHSLKNAFRSLENAFVEVSASERREWIQKPLVRRLLNALGKARFFPGIGAVLLNKAMRRIIFTLKPN